MVTIMRHSLARSRGQILAWGLGLALLAIYIVSLYGTFSEQQYTFGELIQAYPPELMAAFGGTADLFTPPGYLNFTFYSYMPLILGIYAILVGAGLLVGDEEKGILDLILAYPISRSAFFFGRLASYCLTMLAVLFLTWLGFLPLAGGSKLALNAFELALPLLDLFATLFFWGMLALLLSMFLPSARLSGMLAALMLVASFFLTTLARLDENLVNLEKLSPLHYFKGGYAVNGISWDWFTGLIGIGIIFGLLAWLRFQRRDIRVGGEGGWGLGGWSRRSKEEPVL